MVAVDGAGTVRRCHFVPEELGNLYDGSFARVLRPRPCPLDVCDCHIGYVFAGGVLERIPAEPVWLPLPAIASRVADGGN